MEYLLKTSLNKEQYNNLLIFLKEVSNEFILVKRKQFKFNEKAEKIMSDLTAQLVKKITSNEWPGTKLLGNNDLAEIFYFKVNEESTEILKRYSTGLSDWVAPELPEDLAFFRRNGSLILSSVIHEGDCWLDLTDGEVQLIKTRYPVLAEQLIVR